MSQGTHGTLGVAGDMLTTNSMWGQNNSVPGLALGPQQPVDAPHAQGKVTNHRRYAKNEPFHDGHAWFMYLPTHYLLRYTKSAHTLLNVQLCRLK